VLSDATIRTARVKAAGQENLRRATAEFEFTISSPQKSTAPHVRWT